MIFLKTDDEIELLRQSNLLVGMTLAEVAKLIKPGVTSWRNITVGNTYVVCENYNSNLDSHLIKNMEWGAVAYLSKSKYGKNAEVAINSNSSYLTGGGSENSYINNAQQSTTGNVWGIYDMSGSSFEYVAAYVNNGENNLKQYGNTLINAPNYKKDVYLLKENVNDSYSGNYSATAGIYGDAIYETSDTNGKGEEAWYDDFSNFPYGGKPFLYRGGSLGSDIKAGLFAFDAYYGMAYESFSFRPVLI